MMTATQTHIVVRARHQWLREALAGRAFGAVDGRQYAVDEQGFARLPIDCPQHDHPDWELVSGTPLPRPKDPRTGAVLPFEGPLRWVRHRYCTSVQVSGPAPMCAVAVLDHTGIAAVPDNAGFDGHPDYIVGDYLTDMEAAVERVRRDAIKRTAAPSGPSADDREALLRHQLGVGRPNLGLFEQMVDPNSTGVPGVMGPPTQAMAKAAIDAHLHAAPPAPQPSPWAGLVDPNSTGIANQGTPWANNLPPAAPAPQVNLADPNLTGVPGAMVPTDALQAASALYAAPVPPTPPAPVVPPPLAPAELAAAPVTFEDPQSVPLAALGTPRLEAAGEGEDGGDEDGEDEVGAANASKPESLARSERRRLAREAARAAAASLSPTG